MSDPDWQQAMLDSIRLLIVASGEDPNRQGLKETPFRFREAWSHYTSGYSVHPAMVLKAFEDGATDYNELVFQGSIPIWSLCEHHLSPFFGVAHVAYLPDGRIVGLSKLARLVDIFARRLQVQERITTQVAEALMEHLKPKGAAVVLQCRHTCMEARGIQKQGTVTTTTKLMGVFLDDLQIRSELMTYVSMQSRQHQLV